MYLALKNDVIITLNVMTINDHKCDDHMKIYMKNQNLFGISVLYIQKYA